MERGRALRGAVRILSLLAGLVGLGACGGAAESEERSFLADYQARQGDGPAPQRADLNGQWSGVLFCPSGTYPIRLSLAEEGPEKVTGTISIDPNMAKPKVTTPFYMTHIERAATGTYDAIASHLSLVVTPEDGSPPNIRGLGVEAMIDPAERDIALVRVTEYQGPRPRRTCEAGFIGKGAKADTLKRKAQTATALYLARRPIEPGECPGRYAPLIDAALALPARGRGRPDVTSVLASEAFEKVFGKSYTDLDAEALARAGAELRGRCYDGVDEARDAVVHALYATLKSHTTFAQAFATETKGQIIDSWAAHAEAMSADPTGFTFSSAVSLKTVPLKLNVYKDERLTPLIASLEKVTESGKAQDRALNFVKRIERYKDDFERLIALHTEATAREDVDVALAEEGLRYYLTDAASTYAEAASDLKPLVYMASWADQTRKSEACPTGEVKDCAPIIKLFDRTTDKAVKPFVEDEEEAFDALRSEKDKLERLKAAVAFENKLFRTYGPLLDLPAFEAFNGQRLKDRRKLQQQSRRQLTGLVKDATTSVALRAIETDYFYGNDLYEKSSAPVQAALDTQLAGTRPFKNIVGADYFNALYNQEFTALRTLDTDYLSGLRPLLQFGTAQAMRMGPLIDAMLGREQGTAEAEIYREMTNLSVLYPLLGTYLIEYQDVYKKCLKPNARRFTITTRTDQVTVDGFGNEIDRIEGWTTSDAYTINPEFSEQFQILFTEVTGTAQARLFDLFLNDNQVGRLRNGMRTLMREHDCGSPEIKQLEAGFLAYNAEIERRTYGD